MMSSKTWIVSILTMCLAIFILMGSVVYIYDPYCYYRIPSDRLIVNNYRFLNAGLIKNVNYDTAIIGSSMVQNFDMKLFREKLHMSPIKLTVGALSIEGVDVIYSAVKRKGSARNIIFCIDIPSLNKEEDALKVYPLYLYDDDPSNDFRYLYGYETWMRLLPLNLFFSLLEKSGKKLPQFYGTHDIDDIGAWDKDALYGEQYVLRDYQNNLNQISEQNLHDIDARMKKNADKLIEILLNVGVVENEKMSYIFFFPPYSALMWSQAIRSGYFRPFQSAKQYVVDRLDGRQNVSIFDFQILPEIMDLNNYKDTTHYSAKINDLMIEHMANGTMKVDRDTIDDNINQLMIMVRSFDVYLHSKFVVQ